MPQDRSEYLRPRRASRRQRVESRQSLLYVRDSVPSAATTISTVCWFTIKSQQKYLLASCAELKVGDRQVLLLLGPKKKKESSHRLGARLASACRHLISRDGILSATTKVLILLPGQSLVHHLKTRGIFFGTLDFPG